MRKLLANCNLDSGYVDFAVQASFDFLRGSAFEKQGQCFGKIVARQCNGIALAGDIQFRA